MVEVRIPESTARKISDIRRETNPQKALEGIVDLFENYIPQEAYVPVRFDERTGKPTEYKWKPSKDNSHFQPEINLGGENLMDPEPTEPGLESKVVELIKANPVVVDTKLGKYVFYYEERDASGTEQGGGIFNATQYRILVKKVKELK